MGKSSSSSSSQRDATLVGIGLGLVIALVVGSIPLFDDDGSGEPLRAVGLGALLCMPAVLAAIGLKRPPALILAAVLSLPLAFMSFALVTLPLLVPGGFYLAAYLRGPTGKPRVLIALSALVVVGIALASFLALFSSEDPSCYEIVRSRSGELVRRDVEDDTIPPTGPRTVESGCSSDTVTARETFAALAILLVAPPAVWWMTGNKRLSGGLVKD